MAGIVQQLAAPAGREVKQVRKTDESPSRASVIDVAIALVPWHLRAASLSPM